MQPDVPLARLLVGVDDKAILVLFNPIEEGIRLTRRSVEYVDQRFRPRRRAEP
jgi:hypothetical protein